MEYCNPNKFRIAVYRIRNKLNGDAYVGSTYRIPQRASAHRSMLKHKKHDSIHLQRAYDLYGKENFIFEILTPVEFEDRLISREQFYIDYTNSVYNISRFAGNVKLGEESRKKISIARNKWYEANESPFKGKKHSEESRRLIKENHADCSGEKGAFYGKHHTEETKQLFSELRSGENHVFYGKKRPEHSALMKERPPFKDKHHTEENRKIISEKHRAMSEEDCVKAIKLAKEGKTNAEIARIFGCSRAAASRLSNNKIKSFQVSETDIALIKEARRFNNSCESSKLSKLNWTTVDEIRRLRNIEKLSLKVISQKLKISLSMVSAVANFQVWTNDPRTESVK